MNYQNDINITEQRRSIFEKKSLLHQVYQQWYKLLLDGDIGGDGGNPIVELGAGAGFLKDIYPEVISTDILPLSQLDLVCNCLELPFKDATVRRFVMVDVFHHVCDSRSFLKELNRCLVDGGTVAMIEPANTIWARFIWKYFHHEDFSPTTGWKVESGSPLGCANSALPWIVFERDRELFKQQFPLLIIEEYYTHCALTYLLSGGFSYHQMIPDMFNRYVFGFDSLLCRLWKQLGMFLVIKLRKKNVYKKNIIEKKKYPDSVARECKIYRRRGNYYYKNLQKYIRFLIPEGASVLEIGCNTGDLLNSLKPKRGLGVDVSPEIVGLAQDRFSNLEFQEGTLESLSVTETFDYVLLGDVMGYTQDIQKALGNLSKVCRSDTRVIIVYYNYLWEPLIKLAQVIKLRRKRPQYHWLSLGDIKNLIYLAGFETVKEKYHLLIPLYLPLLSMLCNRFLASLPFFRRLALLQILVAKPEGAKRKLQDLSCSVIVPCRNEKGNIEAAVKRLPNLGTHTEIIFVEGHSQDETLAECERVKKVYAHKDITCFTQDGKGKGDAVRKGFSKAKGDILMILDADLTVPPEDLTKFFEAIVSGKGEFINGSRLVYKMEKKAMRFLNVLGNKFFSTAFTFLLEQYIKDTLCGTKVLWRRDYERIVEGRSYFGDFDPFGDFDLLFGAARLNLKIIEIPVHYQDRTYGSTQISRFRHGLLLLRMTFFAMRKIKFI